MFFFHTSNALLVLGGDGIVILHFFNFGLNSLFVLLLESHDFGGLLLGFLNLLPGLHLFLLEQGNTVSEKLGITLDPLVKKQSTKLS
jgi:hypothetical protein